MPGPLDGLRVIEMRGLGPAPFAGMVLSDLGADVVQIDRPGTAMFGPAPRFDLMNRGRRSLSVDLKDSGATELVLDLIRRADVVLEGFRPGVMERMGLGPDVCLARNPGLIYGRMTGWGQDGPRAQQAGHDINYIGLTGVLDAIGRTGEPPTPPLSLVGDFGGGGMLLVVGVLAALHHRRATGSGQVVDAAITDGASLLAVFLHGMLAEGSWSPERGVNITDTGAPFYETYETSDGAHMAVGSIEPKFWAAVVTAMGLPQEWIRGQYDRPSWPAMKQRLTAEFATRTRAEWTKLFADLDACVTPVLSVAEAYADPALAARESFVTVDGLRQPAPAPRFSTTPCRIAGAPAAASVSAEDLLREWPTSAPSRT
jgi:alpha-methylacyl-CoA racemase